MGRTVSKELVMLALLFSRAVESVAISKLWERTITGGMSEE
jgi:hypothetical protein